MQGKQLLGLSREDIQEQRWVRENEPKINRKMNGKMNGKKQKTRQISLPGF
jgi:hypothetical protein